ncbi:MAG: hypothetical protein K9N09_09120 [Candidatus Cloacimonetes bacterium]|nr:hypothetical protein [Candidatus Cloacimonadota bacterium]MCF7814203.1 hypothetical protein [Candidatus Cloacimonadota bacterium]MCF7868848.1 hypothetical protein [Candidatus Cloacimonadota bacterium]MCF7884259.1 hypothetical protein [Candidatus Cloacimonadota bacterium]
MPENNDTKKEKNDRLIQKLTDIIANAGLALFSLYKFEGAVWTDSKNIDEGLIMSSEGVSTFFSTLKFIKKSKFNKLFINMIDQGLFLVLNG